MTIPNQPSATASHHPTCFRGFRSPNYTPVPDELFDELLGLLSGAEVKVLLYIVRRTFGFKKQKERISLSQIRGGITTREGRVLDRGTGLSLSASQDAIKGLIAKGVITTQRNRSAEKGDQATTYSLRMLGQQDDAGQDEAPWEHREQTEDGGNQGSGKEHARAPGQGQDPVGMAPVTGNRQGGIPKGGTARYRQSATQETVYKQTEISVRKSKVLLQEELKADTGNSGNVGLVRAAHPAVSHATPRHRGVMRSLAEVLAARQPHTPPSSALGAEEPCQSARVSGETEPRLSHMTWPSQSPRSRYGRIKPTPQLAAAITEIAQEFGDLRHLAANCTQSMRVWERAGWSESRFVGALYEARAITKQQPRVVNRMSYFWIVVRDLVHLLDASPEAPATRQPPPTGAAG